MNRILAILAAVLMLGAFARAYADDSPANGAPAKTKAAAKEEPVRAAVVSISRAKACRKRSSSIGACRTWLLKSQYGHFDRQNGQCT